jgi:hypothetical protein
MPLYALASVAPFLCAQRDGCRRLAAFVSNRVVSEVGSRALTSAALAILSTGEIGRGRWGGGQHMKKPRRRGYTRGFFGSAYGGTATGQTPPLAHFNINFRVKGANSAVPALVCPSPSGTQAPVGVSHTQNAHRLAGSRCSKTNQNCSTFQP